MTAPIIKPTFEVYVPTRNYHLKGVVYDGRYFDVDIGAKLFTPRSQYEYAQKAKYALTHPRAREYHTVSLPFLHAMLRQLHQLIQNNPKDLNAEAMRAFFQEALTSSEYVLTLSRVLYSHKGNDTITHEITQETTSLIHTNLTGETRRLVSGHHQSHDLNQALFGDSASGIGDTYTGLFGKKVNLTHKEKKPEQDLEAAVGIGIDKYYVGVNFNLSPGKALPALAMRVH